MFTLFELSDGGVRGLTPDVTNVPAEGVDVISAQQRCTNHKTMNVIDKLPKIEQPEAIYHNCGALPLPPES